MIPLLEKMHSALPKVKNYVFCETKTVGITQTDLENLSAYPKMESLTEIGIAGELTFIRARTSRR
jgi:long-chain acyl-CoA synthetase